MADERRIAFHEFGTREKMDAEEMTAVFTKVASTYDKTWKSMNYMDHVYVSDAVADFYNPERAPSIRILDIAAGTGMLAEELWKRGFRNIDGLDPSEGMMKEAMKKNVYTNYFLEYMDGNPVSRLITDTYDCAVVAAAFNTGLLPCAAVGEMIRLIKPDGLICFGIPDSRFTEVKDYIDRLRPLMTWMEEEGMWSLLGKINYREFYDNSGPGTVYRYIVKTSKVDCGKIFHKLSTFS